MPFLFVDYDQGAGGERFCAGLSQSVNCNPLTFARYENGRTKVLDVFEQEFLKPHPTVSNTVDPTDLYTIVPCHRNTKLAQDLIGPVSSIRIQLPKDDLLFYKIKEQQVQKVLLTREPTPQYFFGLIKILQETAEDPTFVQRVNYQMLTVEIILLSKGIEPTQENIDVYIQKLKTYKMPEPDFDYDLAIPYEDLVYRPDQVAQQLKETFDIDVVGNWLQSYGTNN